MTTLCAVLLAAACSRSSQLHPTPGDAARARGPVASAHTKTGPAPSSAPSLRPPRPAADAEPVRAAIRQVIGRSVFSRPLSGCGEKACAHARPCSKVIADFAVGPDGKVDHIVVRSLCADPAIEACHAAAIRQLRFPRQQHRLDVHYPFFWHCTGL